MPGNPRECRQHALSAQRFAETARTADERQRLLSLADTWLSLAAELESMESLLDALREMKADEAQADEAQADEAQAEGANHLEPP
jgi:hypothetical protein